MIRYAVVEILGRQYKVEPEKAFEVNFVGEKSSFVCDKVIMKAEDDAIEFGSPYLKETLSFEVVGKQTEKVRVFKYHPKANSRRTRGEKKQTSILKLQTKREKSEAKV